MINRRPGKVDAPAAQESMAVVANQPWVKASAQAHVIPLAGYLCIPLRRGDRRDGATDRMRRFRPSDQPRHVTVIDCDQLEVNHGPS